MYGIRGTEVENNNTKLSLWGSYGFITTPPKNNLENTKNQNAKNIYIK